MLTVAKNQIKVMLLSVKYNIMREMTNRVTFLTNVCFMILNNACFIIQWILLFHLRTDIGGFSLNDVMVLWGFAASTYGLSHIFFQRAFELPGLIMNGKLDSFLVQPKSVLLSVISSGTNPSAIGDFLYGYLVIIFFKFSIINLLLFTILSILGAFIFTGFSVIIGSISFWIIRGDLLSENITHITILFSTYPDTIFKGLVRLLFYSILPVGFYIYMPMKILLHFNIYYFLCVVGVCILIILLAFFIFYRGLKRYTSSSLMSARI